jgi:hypothetical protein
MAPPESSLLDTKLDRILQETLEATDEDLIVVNPSEEIVAEFVKVAGHFEGTLPKIRMIAEERTLKSAVDDFIVASNAADLVDRETLSIRTIEGTRENSLLVTPDTVVALVDTGSTVAGLTTDNQEFIDDAFEAYAEEFEAAEEFTLRTPPISRVRQTLSDEITPGAEEDFSAILSSLETARGNGDGLDEVTISLLVAAKNEVLLYDISRWGEDIGIASKATFSRTKTKLEDMGIIDTEKVPIDVGRPRLRLKLADDRLRNAEGDQLASVASSILS